jgi:hypothetical protein
MQICCGPTGQDIICAASMRFDYPPIDLGVSARHLSGHGKNIDWLPLSLLLSYCCTLWLPGGIAQNEWFWSLTRIGKKWMMLA